MVGACSDQAFAFNHSSSGVLSSDFPPVRNGVYRYKLPLPAVWRTCSHRNTLRCCAQRA